MLDIADIARGENEWKQGELDLPGIPKKEEQTQFDILSDEAIVALCDEANERHARGELTSEELDAFLAEFFTETAYSSLTVADIEQTAFINQFAGCYQPKILVNH